MSIIKFPIFSLVFCHGSYFVAIGTSFCSNNAVHRQFRATRLHNSTLFFGLRGGCFCADLTFVLRFLHVAWGMHVEQEGAHIACQERWHVVQVSLSMYSRLCIPVVKFGHVCLGFAERSPRTQNEKVAAHSKEVRISRFKKVWEGIRRHIRSEAGIGTWCEQRVNSWWPHVVIHQLRWFYWPLACWFIAEIKRGSQRPDWWQTWTDHLHLMSQYLNLFYSFNSYCVSFSVWCL